MSRSGEARRRFACEVFEELTVDGHQLAAIKPNAAYAPFFLADREARSVVRCDV